jgi:poly(A) polymerase
MTSLANEFRGWLDRPQTQQILTLLNGDGATTRCVGGCVRDALMRLATADTEVDMATDLPPKEVMARLEKAKIKCVPTGIKHGTVSAILYDGDTPLVYEITTLRVDVTTDGRHAEVAFTADWAGDAARRDFTINALYADADGTLHDPTGDGLADIAANRVRFIGDATARIEEDYLRVLRYFRFHFRLTPDAAPDADALAACTAGADGLAALSGERKQQEMLKIMALAAADKAAQALHEADLLPPVLGVQPTDFAPLSAMLKLSDDPLLRLMSVLPSAPTSEKGAAQKLADTLRLSKKQTLRLMQGVQTPLDLSALAHALYFDGAQAVADRALLALASGQAEDAAARAPYEAAVQAAQDYERPKFPLTGAMMQKAGLADGPQMGQMASALEQWWVAQGFPDSAAVEAELKRRVEAAS